MALYFNSYALPASNLPHADIKSDILFNYQKLSQIDFISFLQQNISSISDSVFYEILGDGIKEQSEPCFKTCLYLSFIKHNSQLQGMALYFFGRYIERKQDPARARTIFNNACAYFDTAGFAAGKGMAKDGIGDTYFNEYNYREAQRYYIEALSYASAASDTQTEIDIRIGIASCRFALSDIIGTENAIAVIDSLIRSGGSAAWQINYSYLNGKLNYAKGRLGDAVKNYHKALKCFSTDDDSTTLSRILLGLAETAMMTGNDNIAAKYCDDILKISNPPLMVLSETCKYLGIIEQNSGNYNKALEYYKLATDFSLKDNNHAGAANGIRRTADLLMMRNDTSGAEAKYLFALAEYIEHKNYYGQGNMNLSLGNIYLARKSFSAAKDCYEKALAQFAKSGIIEGSAFAKYYYAKYYAAISDSRALSLFKEAFALFDRIRFDSGDDEAKVSYSTRISELYSDAIMYLLKNRYNKDAFELCEKMRGRAFLEHLGGKKLLQITKGLSFDLKRERDSLCNAISMINTQILEAKTDLIADSLKSVLRSSEDQISNLIEKIKTRHPEYASVFYPQPVETEYLQKKVLRDNEVLLEYFLADTSSYIFLIRQKSFDIISIPVPYNNLVLKINSYLKTIKSPRSSITDSWLYEVLIPNGKLKKGEKLIIVPDKELHALPFETLYSGQSYLISDHQINYIQSASVLAVCRQGMQGKSRGKSFLGLGDPLYGTGLETGGNSKLEDNSNYSKDPGRLLRAAQIERCYGSLPRLEGSGEEVKNICNIFRRKGLSEKQCLKTEASESVLKSLTAKNSNYILIACHGILTDEFQGLALTQDPNANDDGILTPEELMNLDWEADLVALSACQTGKGKITRGEGVIGLTRAVFYAGSRSVLASLWSVSDNGTKELMQRTFSNIIEKGSAPAEALWNAKLSMLNSKDFNHPYFWGPFILFSM